jgi:uncharacterized Zn-finger protein
MDPQSKNNDVDEDDSRRSPDAQSDPEYKPKDHVDDDSSEEDDVTLQRVGRSKRKSERYASKMHRKSLSLEPKRGTNTQKKSKTHGDDTEVSSARPVSCPICHRQFKGPFAKANLKTHLDIHAPEPKYPCPHCPSRFKQKHNRYQHIKIIHLKVKPVKQFACQYCAKKFTRAYQKKIHERVRNIATTDFVFLPYLAVYNSG